MLGLMQKSEHSSALFCKSSRNISGSNMRFSIRRDKRRAIPCAKHLDPEYWGARVVNLRYPYYISLLYGRNIVSLPYRPYRPLRKSLVSIIISELVNFAAFTRLKSGRLTSSLPCCFAGDVLHAAGIHSIDPSLCFLSKPPRFTAGC